MKLLYLLFLPWICFAQDSVLVSGNDSNMETATDSNKTMLFQPLISSSIEPFPIIMYDTDIGFGYGAKVFFLNCIGYSESLDLLAFNSSKGERWYRASFSLPDIEYRQGKIYAASIDITADYDKLIMNSFFGIGNYTKYDDREYYTKETIDLNVSVSRGFSKSFIGAAGVRYKSFSNSGISPDGRLIILNEKGLVTTYSFFAIVRYDCRNSFINPTEGIVIQGDVESSVKMKNGDLFFLNTGLSVQNYYTLFSDIVFASRLSLKSISGGVPVHLLLALGGNNTLRGFPQDRFKDNAFLLFNSELRFPIVWRFGGLLGVDAGRVFNSLSAMGFTDYKLNLAAGLRFYMNNFVVRLDTGLSSEAMGLYFNFGHIF